MSLASNLLILKNCLFYKYKYKKDTCNLIFYDCQNFGDQLSPVIFEYMLNKAGLSSNSRTISHYTFLSCLGSILSYQAFVNKTLWGTGSYSTCIYSGKLRHFKKLDVRCVRGPLTENLLFNSKMIKVKTHIYGDPGLLMPFIYPCKKEKKYDISVIPHHCETIETKYHIINPKTKDWKFVIDQICESKLIISSSLHGIILAEAYGVPAVWLSNKNSSQDEFKYLDYYYSTERPHPCRCSTVEEGAKLKPKIPNLGNLQQNLLNSFPYDLWRKS